MRYRSLIALLVLLGSAAVLAQPAPKVTLLQPSRDALIGSDVTFCVTFDNKAGTAAGFAPFIDLAFDLQGADGTTSPCDGVSFVKAEVVSTTPHVPLTPVAPPVNLPPCGNGSPTHPLAASTAGWPGAGYPSPTPPYSQLVTMRLPFGSFQPTQPELRIDVTVHIDKFADENRPLTVQVLGGFQYGATATNTTLPIFSTWVTETITPKVLILTKRFLGAEEEVVPGPNFADDYEIVVDVAPGQVINNLKLNDCASLDVQFLSVTSAAGATTTIGPPNCFTATYGPLTGPAAGHADTLTAHFRVTNALPLGPPPCSRPVTNKVSTTAGTWQPLDPRDALTNVNASASATITKKAIAIRSSVSGTPIPLNVLTYTLTFRISAFSTFRDLVIDDFLADGLSAPLPGTTTYSVTSGSTTASGNLPPGLITVIRPVAHTYKCPATGTTPCDSMQPATLALTGAARVQFNLWAQIGSSFPNGLSNATGTLTFKVRVNQQFAFGPHSTFDADRAVDKDDPLLAHATITGTGLPSLAKCIDDTISCLAVPTDTFVKEVVAKNGQYFSPIPGPITTPLPQFTPGDTITYRLTKVIPSGNAETLTVQDFLPAPVLDVAGLVLGPPCPPASACLSITPAAVPSSAPALTTNTADNSFTITFGNHLNWPPNTAVTIVIEFTRTITNDPFADGLYLTNDAVECERNSYGAGPICQAAIAQFELTEPSLRIRKGILCPITACPPVHPIENPNLPTLEAQAPGPIDPGIPLPPKAICKFPAPCPRFTGVVTSNTVAAFTSTKTALADANDVVTFVIAVENIGNGPNGAFDVTLTDVLPTGLTYVPNTLCVTRGDGTALATTGTFPASITLDDNLNGPLAAFSPTSGQNIAVLTFDAKIGPPSQIKIGSCLRNDATLTGYSNHEGGSNFVMAGFTPPFTDSATVCIRPKVITKGIVSTSEPHTLGGPVPKLAIGEVIQFQLCAHIPEGTGSLRFDDPLPPGLQFLSLVNVTVGNATSLTYSGPVVSGNVVFDFGTVTNNDNDPECEILCLRFNALVLNSAVNNDGNVKTNAFSVIASNTNVGTSNTVQAVIVEPQLGITKTGSVQGSVVTYTVTVTNPSAVTAFNVAITDTPQACLTGLTVVSATSANGASTPVTSGTTVTVASIPQSGSVTVTFRATQACKDCSKLNNTATVRWTSLPGNGSQTPGASGAPNGERNGNGGVNDYVASASFSICGRVCGIKFSDPNRNGIQDPGEPGLSGWTITATDANGNVVATAVTGAGGQYCLTLAPGTYQICETAQPKWVQTFPSPPCHTVTITPGALIQPRNFGNRECWARVCGTKRGIRPGAPAIPLAGWTIVAFPQIPGPPISAVTDANGHYCLDLPGPGAYTITEVQQTGWQQVAPPQPYEVFIECVPSPAQNTPGSAVVKGGISPNALNFTNSNLCAGVQCKAGEQCEVHDGKAVCVVPPAISPCANIHCGFGTHCAVINGVATCVP